MRIEIRSELTKLLRKPRTWIGPAAMLVLIVIILIAVKYGREFRHMQEALSQDFIISGTFVNAAFLTRFMLLPPVVFMFLPLFTCMVFGDVLASEAADGTMRTLMSRPVTRSGVAVSKYLVAVLYTVLLTLGTGGASYLLGALLLGRGSMLSFAGGISILPEGQAVVRLLEVYILIAAGMTAVGSIAFAISTFLNNPNGAIGGAVGLLVVFGIVGSIEYFDWLKPYLLTTYLMTEDYFRSALPVGAYLKSLGVMLAYCAVFFAVGLLTFRRKDILS